MIRLKFIKKHIFVFNVDDWIKLRKTHRIVGHITGNTSFIPSLPAKLLPEEALLLLNENVAIVYETNDVPTEIKGSSNSSRIFEDDFLLAQQQEYKKIRQEQLMSLIDKIVEKRRKLGDQRSKEDIFNEELNKSSTITKINMIWPILLQDTSENIVPISKELLLPLTTPLKTTVFADLWKRGYYITSGEKFGGDFLVYFGDPIVHHAIFIVKCIDWERTFTPTELIAFGRLGVSVKKRAILAGVKDKCVIYMTINWIDA